MDRSSVVFRFRIVREFCFVKCDARGIPAYAGMTWEGAGMMEAIRGNDVDTGEMT